MDPLISALAGGLLRPLMSAVVNKATRIGFGSPQSRELRRVIDESLAVVVKRHPGIAAISVDIDLLGNDVVADELLLATVPGWTTNWDAARQRWFELYGSPPDGEVIEFLSGLAENMRFALQRSFLLQGVWSALTMERQSAQLQQVLDAIGHPKAAIGLNRDRISDDLDYAVGVANALGEAFGSGLAGQHLELRPTASGDVQLVALPGADIRVRLTKTVPDTEQGHQALADLSTALRTGREVDMGEVGIEMTVGGKKMTLPADTAHVVASRATRQLKVLLDLAITGVDELRLIVDGDAYLEEDGTLQFESSSSNHEPVKVALTLRKSGQTTMRLSIPEDASYSLRQQVFFERVLRFIAIGGRVTIEFLDPPYTKGTTEVPGNADLGGVEGALQAVLRLDELQSRLGLDLPAIDSISAKDDAVTAWALSLMKEGEAPGIWNGRMRLTGTSELAKQLERHADADHKVVIRYHMEHLTIELDSGLEFDLGTVEHSIRGALLEGPQETEPGVFEAELVYDAATPQSVRRLLEDVTQDRAAPGSDEAP